MRDCYNIVKIDIDVPYDLFKKVLMDKYLRVVEYVVEHVFGYHITSIRSFVSPGLKTHVYIELRECVDEAHVILLQFFCYSDHRRFVFNLQRLVNLGKSLDRLYPP
ncbi:MAG: hypothetical protein QXK07_07120 [Desulfurococcaceae archaeon]